MFETPLRSLMSFVNILVVTLMAGLVFEGNNSIAYTWQPMEDDYSLAELNQLLHPELMAKESDSDSNAPAEVVDDPLNYVLWLNISGMRTDYTDKASSSFFDQAGSRGLSSNKLIPSFPTLRWPSLISQATGTTADVHGIVSDAMLNPATNEVVRNPTDLALLKAEPIWTTAKKQGIRVLVHNWPFSQVQPAEHAVDVSLPEFDPSQKDASRLKVLLDAWAANAGTGEDRLRLVMASLNGLDDAARKEGCRSPGIYSAFSNLNSELNAFFDELKNSWPDLARNGDLLFVILSTDHGMVDVTKLVNLSELIADDMRPYAKLAFSDTMGHVWVQNLPEGVTMETALEKIEEAMGDRIYWDIYRKDVLPEDWMLGDGPHIGDLVIQLKSGYAFTDQSGSEAVFEPSEVGGQVAASGLTVRSSSRMRGSTWIYEWTERRYSQDGEEIDATQLHATVCKILGIEPAEQANPNPVAFEIAAE
ncbi:MAG: nucleotide pyrophosphatase/phosphodiesterase family protein [Verrucomicrobiota bacterium]